MIHRFLRRLFSVLRALGPELLAGVWRVIVLIFLFLLHILRIIYFLICKFFGKEDDEDDKRCKCNKVPEHVKRKPDPCLYSQFYLRAQGLSVTWDNPDIWITLPDGTPVASSDLIAGTDYLVNVRIHDASFDPSLVTEVRCFYRPWSFNHPDRVPLETNPDGSEKVVLLNIAPWGSEVAQFRWQTPNNDAHYCLQAECLHPDDKNPNNNLGQENTNVTTAPAGGSASAQAFLINNDARTIVFRIETDQFRLQERNVELSLKTRDFPLRRKPIFDSVQKRMITYDQRSRVLKGQERSAPQVRRYAYNGWDEVRAGNEAGAHAIESGWSVRVGSNVVVQGQSSIELNAGQSLDVPINIQIPTSARSGNRHAFNSFAFTERGKPIGGVTIYVDVI